MKKIIITGIVIVAALAGIMYVLNNNKEKNEAETAVVAETNAAVAVRVDTVQVKDINADNVVNGTFAPIQQLNLSAETSGQVQKVFVKEGDRVQVGQTLAIIKADKFNVGVNNAQAAYNTALADANRFESAYQTGGVTKQQLDQVKLQLENAKNNLANARINSSDAVIKATIPGIINSKNVEPGTFVNPGQGLFDIVNISELKLKVTVDEKNVAGLKVGDKIEITTSVFPTDAFWGKITFIAPKADASLNFPVEILVTDNPDQKLKAGMYANAHFGLDSKTPILVVPRNAFVGSVSSNQIFVAKNNKAVLTQVTSGRSFGDYIEVLSGLNAGEVVITSGQINLFNDSPIKIIN
ncbi:efflux RND transporter periplasmic adaptor subunit [Flavobacterium agricola]|uniref:Efflux RND transporter periplasmic adaptor subunit n=1 Tax=Flavobacterium agricola TaxID=2870839 RepID=A0ABY6LY57_9FLAO|nr:efflux RND transporter periplasmic adaptor subunit [Flavobacterium agricola]UYW01241.1 efflux RND transporter periplasmic adaptor subunit [Flavobacterium agricola]